MTAMTHGHVTEHRFYNPHHPFANSPEIENDTGRHGNHRHGTYQAHLDDHHVVNQGDHTIHHVHHGFYHGNHNLHHGDQVMHHGNHGFYSGNQYIHHGNHHLLDVESNMLGYAHTQPYPFGYHGNHVLHGHLHGNHHDHHHHHHHGNHAANYHDDLHRWHLYNNHDHRNHGCIHHHRQREGCCRGTHCGCTNGNGGCYGNSHYWNCCWCRHSHGNHPHLSPLPPPSPPSPNVPDLPPPRPKSPRPLALPEECPICKFGQRQREGCAVCDTMVIGTREVTLPDLPPAAKVTLRKPKVKIIRRERSEVGSKTFVEEVRRGPFDHFTEDHADLNY